MTSSVVVSHVVPIYSDAIMNVIFHSNVSCRSMPGLCHLKIGGALDIGHKLLLGTTFFNNFRLLLRSHQKVGLHLK